MKEPDWWSLGKDDLIRIAAINAWHTARILGHIRWLLFTVAGAAVGMLMNYQFTGSWRGWFF